MRLAAYNVENLFQRARALNSDSPTAGRAALNHHAKLNAILANTTYTPADKKEIVELLTKLGLAKEDDGGSFVVLRQNRGRLVSRPQSGGPMKVVANGRGDWLGWVDLKLESVDEVATRNTARIVQQVAPDVLAVIEAESRPALLHFQEDVFPSVGAQPFSSLMLIDGNDDRGIDVGVMLRAGYSIESMRSHVDDVNADGVRVFSRDCPEYAIRTPAGNRLVLLVNHLKSKGFGSQVANNKRRLQQAERVKAIYEGLVAAGEQHVAVVGDLNDSPDSAALAPLLVQTNLRDISSHPAFVSDGRPGTYKNGTAKDKIDYILLSPALFDAVTGGGVNRAGVWGGTNGTLFPHIPEVTRESQAASDHAAIFADIAL